jgi:hypothetical protein
MLFSFLSIPLILAIICIIHIVKTGKDRVWIYVVVFIPVIGSVAYFVTEILPSLFSGRKTREIARSFSNSVFGDKKIKDLESLVKLADTYQNKYALAEAHLAVKNYDKAIEIFLSCRTGIYSDDPHLLQVIAHTYTLIGDWVNARQYFEKVVTTNQLDKKYRVMYALSLVSTGENGKPEEIFRELEKESNIEGTYEYAKFLEKTGKPELAKKKYEYIVFIASTIPRFVFRENKKWIELSKEALRG